MAKSKKKVKDFNKVKLKVGKKLKKPTETDTTFKSGKVILLEQLKRKDDVSESVPSTNRKLTLTDVLHNFRHYNTNVRKDSVIGLKELLRENPQLIRQHLCELIANLGTLLSDVEPEILKTATAVWEQILSTVDSDTLSPYFQLLSAHLTCAMTHLNADNQRYSLKVFNLLLTLQPDVFRNLSTSNDLVRCFLNSLPQRQASNKTGGAASHSLLPSSTKHNLLKIIRNILPLFTSKDQDDGLPEKTTVADCRSSASAIVSVSLSAAERSRNRCSGFDDYVNAQQPAAANVEQYLAFFDAIVPFCHSLWIEVTSVEDQSTVDCFTFDLASLLIMDDILFIFNSLLRQPVGVLTSANPDADIDAIRSSVEKLATKSFVERYSKILPCHRAPRKSGDEARLSGNNTNVDVCYSVNLGLCRFLAYISLILENRVPYPVEKISDVLSHSFSGKKKSMDSETLRCAAELVRDLRRLISSRQNTFSTHIRQSHFRKLGELLVDCLLAHSKRLKTKLDIITWICEDLENFVNMQEWPKFSQLVAQLPLIVSALLDESKHDSAKSASVHAVFYRVTRIFLLRTNDSPLGADGGLGDVKSDLLSLLLSRVEFYPPSFKKEVLNLLYYAVPLPETVERSICNLRERDLQFT